MQERLAFGVMGHHQFTLQSFIEDDSAKFLRAATTVLLSDFLPDRNHCPLHQFDCCFGVVQCLGWCQPCEHVNDSIRSVVAARLRNQRVVILESNDAYFLRVPPLAGFVRGLAVTGKNDGALADESDNDGHGFILVGFANHKPLLSSDSRAFYTKSLSLNASGVPLENPNGIPALSPAVARHELPWVNRHTK